MTAVLIGFIAGWVTAIVTVKLYVMGKLRERWYIKGNTVEQGYEVLLKKGKERIVIYRVQFDRPSSRNPDTTFSDQLAQARVEATAQAATLNAHEQLARDTNRKNGTPGGIT